LGLAAALIGAALAACASASPSGATLVAVDPSASTTAIARIVDPPRMPGPQRAREESAVAENALCERCHADVARDWNASLHKRADIEPAYLASFQIEPLPFCRGCHAPESNPDVREADDVRDLGVGCVTCHVTAPGTVLAAPRLGAIDPWRDAPETSPHRIVRDARFAGDGACAGCHEFTFPGRSAAKREDLMQGTIAEHAESPASDRACADCHMPEGPNGKRTHRFIASRDPAAVARAVEIHVERLDSTHVRVDLAPKDLGHAFPTGDLFRRVEIAAWAEGDDSGDHRRVRYLARHFGSEGQTIGRKLLTDDRVRREGASVTLEIPAAADKPIRWRIAYQRVSHPNGIDEQKASLEGELELAAGTLEPQR
jgi:hypothetical protein